MCFPICDGGESTARYAGGGDFLEEGVKRAPPGYNYIDTTVAKLERIKAIKYERYKRAPPLRDNKVDLGKGERGFFRKPAVARDGSFHIHRDYGSIEASKHTPKNFRGGPSAHGAKRGAAPPDLPKVTATKLNKSLDYTARKKL